MKKIIRKKVYNTETSTLVRKHTEGAFGDEAGYEESLYQAPSGLYFLYVNGGSESPYVTEDILSISKAKAADWLEAHK